MRVCFSVSFCVGVFVGGKRGVAVLHTVDEGLRYV